MAFTLKKESALTSAEQGSADRSVNRGVDTWFSLVTYEELQASLV
jgi:hypothetical protein